MIGNDIFSGFYYTALQSRTEMDFFVVLSFFDLIFCLMALSKIEKIPDRLNRVDFEAIITFLVAYYFLNEILSSYRSN